MAAEPVVEVLTRENSLPFNRSPIGTVYGVKRMETAPFFQICITEPKIGGSIPDELNGMYTKESIAEEHIRNYLNAMWDRSDRASLRGSIKRKEVDNGATAT